MRLSTPPVRYIYCIIVVLLDCMLALSIVVLLDCLLALSIVVLLDCLLALNIVVLLKCLLALSASDVYNKWNLKQWSEYSPDQ